MRRGFTTCCVLLAMTSVAWSQGRDGYFNVESPTVKPITVARIEGKDLLLVCNPPDNSVEIYDTDESMGNAFLARVPVGLEPVSVEFNPTNNRFYTANFLGDSISSVELGWEDGLRVTPRGTAFSGNEPMDIAIVAGGTQVLVTHRLYSAASLHDAEYLSFVYPEIPAIDLVDYVWQAAVKEGRTIAYHEPYVYVLNGKGGQAGGSIIGNDFDVWLLDLSDPLSSLGNQSFGGLGTSNFNMTVASNGDLYVVGGEAQVDVTSEPALADELTGFVQSTIYRVRRPSHTDRSIERKDLNLLDDNVAVAKSEALAMPMDVVLYEPNGVVEKVYVVAFGSDRIGVLSGDLSSEISTWNLKRAEVPTPPGGVSPVTGPRGLCLQTGLNGGSEDRLYVFNRLDNSVSVFDVKEDTLVASWRLQHDPRPDHILLGQEFLYSAEHSNNGFVSCASCHVDGRTDAIAWNLGSGGPHDPVEKDPFRPELLDGFDVATIENHPGQLLDPDPQFFNTDKGDMVTQSFQGLLNYDVDQETQAVVTNAPYHWRGDRASFLNFNKAFVGLMGLPNLNPGGEPKGLLDEDMSLFEDFVNSISYPPNPEQLATREYSGSFGPVEDANSTAVGEGAQLGMKVFHLNPITDSPGAGDCAGRSCVGCHSLPEGSNNRYTVINGELLESAAMRGLVQKEFRLERPLFFPPGAPGQNYLSPGDGLTHLGFTGSINDFIREGFGVTGPGGGPSSDYSEKELDALIRFSREMDHGASPKIGASITITSDAPPQWQIAHVLALEAEAEKCNCGLSVSGSVGDVMVGYYYDLSQSSLVGYTSHDGNLTLSRVDLLSTLTGEADLLTFVGVPLGAERRAASPSGVEVPLDPVEATNCQLLPMAPQTAWENVPNLTGNWDIAGSDPFVWLKQNDPTPVFLKAHRLMQHGILNDASFDHGLANLRHDAPRRFRMAGDDIQHGAILHISILNDSRFPNGPPDIQRQPEDDWAMLRMHLPIHPSGDLFEDKRVWETAADIEPLQYLQWILGGPKAKSVARALEGSLPEPPGVGTFVPDQANYHWVEVENPGGVRVAVGWQRITLE